MSMRDFKHIPVNSMSASMSACFTFQWCIVWCSSFTLNPPFDFRPFAVFVRFVPGSMQK